MKKIINAFALSLTLAPLSAAFATAIQPQPAATDSKLVQFRADDHVVGFLPNKVMLVQSDHSLTAEFVGARTVEPAIRISGAQTDRRQLAELGRVEYPNLWNGITARFESDNDGVAESTYLVAPGADVSRIQLRYNATTTLQPDGTLRHALPTKRGWITETKPVAWQDINGKRISVAVSFNIEHEHVGFRVGPYDKKHELVIDPVYQWHTFYGSVSDDGATSIAIDASDNVYVTGWSDATWNGSNNQSPKHPHSGNTKGDLFVLKLDSTGSYQWHTFYGSTGGSVLGGAGIAVGGDGNVVVAATSATAWVGDGGAAPIRAYDNTTTNSAILKLGSNGSYKWHTFYPQSFTSLYGGAGVASDSSGNVYIAGGTVTAFTGDSGQNPLHPLQTSATNLMLLKLNSNGTYAWHTYYGLGGYLLLGFGSGLVATDDAVYTSGWSQTSWNGDNNTAPLHGHSGDADLFVMKLSSSGAYQWHTFHGGTGADMGGRLAVNGGSVYLMGSSNASWLGNGVTAPLNSYSGKSDIVIVKLTDAGAYQWHTFYGSTDDDGGAAILGMDGLASDSAGNVYITTLSSKKWQGDGGAEPRQSSNTGGGWVALKLSGTGAYQWHTFYGFGVYQFSQGLALDSNSNMYVTGWGIDWSPFFGTTGTAPLHGYSGDTDIWVAKLDTDYVGNGGTPTTPDVPNNPGTPNSPDTPSGPSGPNVPGSGGGGMVTPIQLLVALFTLGCVALSRRNARQ